MALLLLVAVPAGAHTSAPAIAAPSSVAPAAVAPAAPAAIGAAAPAADLPLWPWLALAALVPALARRRAAKLLVTAVALLLVVFGAESALHSVHHGVAGERTALCPVASAAAHVAGTDVETVAVAAPAPALEPALEESDPLASKLRRLGPHQGRAPPSALA